MATFVRVTEVKREAKTGRPQVKLVVLEFEISHGNKSDLELLYQDFGIALLKSLQSVNISKEHVMFHSAYEDSL